MQGRWLGLAYLFKINILCLGSCQGDDALHTRLAVVFEPYHVAQISLASI